MLQQINFLNIKYVARDACTMLVTLHLTFQASSALVRKLLLAGFLEAQDIQKKSSAKEFAAVSHVVVSGACF